VPLAPCLCKPDVQTWPCSSILPLAALAQVPLAKALLSFLSLDISGHLLFLTRPVSSFLKSLSLPITIFYLEFHLYWATILSSYSCEPPFSIFTDVFFPYFQFIVRCYPTLKLCLVLASLCVSSSQVSSCPPFFDTQKTFPCFLAAPSPQSKSCSDLILIFFLSRQSHRSRHSNPVRQMVD